MFNTSMKSIIYIISVILLAFFICFMLSALNILPNDAMVSYLLALIASNSILKEVRKFNKS